MEVVLGIDLGTSYFKFGIFDRTGRLLGLGRVAPEIYRNDRNRRELPVERFWEALRDGLSIALERASCNQGDIRAAAYSSQANSFLFLNRQGEPLTPLVLWPDRRADEVDPAVEELWRRNDFLEKTGCIIHSVESAVVKYRWFRTHQPDTWQQVDRIQTISDYLTFSLTGETVGDEGTASLLGLWDTHHHRWWQEALDTIGIQTRQLSTPLAPGTVAGAITARGAERLGLMPGIPFVVGSLDHHVAAIGAGLDRLAPVSESTGTVLAALRSSNEYRPNPAYCTGSGTHREGYFNLAFSGNGAGALEWYRNHHAPEFTIEGLLELAGGVPAGCDGLVAQPCPETFPGLEGFLNVQRFHGHGHYVRAILESVAANLAELVGVLFPSDFPGALVATGGGAQSDLWLRIKATLLELPVIRPRCKESACLGAAMFAACAAGWFPTLEEAGTSMISTDHVFEPD